MTAAMVPRVPRRKRRESKWPLLAEILWFRLRLRLTLWRHQGEQKLEVASVVIHMSWLWLGWQFWRTLRRMLNRIIPPR